MEVKGWECPKCGRVNAPFVRSCDCYKEDNIGKPAMPGLQIPFDKDYKQPCLWDCMPETSPGSGTKIGWLTCLWDGMPETSPGSGTKIGWLSCPCPKCNPRC